MDIVCCTATDLRRHGGCFHDRNSLDVDMSALAVNRTVDLELGGSRFAGSTVLARRADRSHKSVSNVQVLLAEIKVQFGCVPRTHDRNVVLSSGSRHWK